MNVFAFISVVILSDVYAGYVTNVQTVTQEFADMHQCQLVAPQMASQIRAQLSVAGNKNYTDTHVKWQCYDAVNYADQKKD